MVCLGISRPQSPLVIPLELPINWLCFPNCSLSSTTHLKP
jgi:hypothetical protein